MRNIFSLNIEILCFLGGENNNVDCFVFAFSGHGHIEEGNIEEGNIEEGNIEEGLSMLMLFITTLKHKACNR